MKLSKEFVQRMIKPSDPEMSFQICTVGMKWGRVYERAILIDGELRICETPFNEDDISFLVVEDL